MRYILSILFMMILAAPGQVDARESVKEQKEKDKAFAEAVSGALGNFIAIESGRLKSGEQIPLLAYADGTQAKRKDTHYFVSPSEVPTSVTYVQTSGAFYIKCEADPNGFVFAELWQQSGTGKGLKLVGSDTYAQVKRQLKTEGYSITGAEPVVAEQMKVLSQHLWVNYMAIAIRSSEK